MTVNQRLAAAEQRVVEARRRAAEAADAARAVRDTTPEMEVEAARIASVRAAQEASAAVDVCEAWMQVADQAEIKCA